MLESLLVISSCLFEEVSTNSLSSSLLWCLQIIQRDNTETILISVLLNTQHLTNLESQKDIHLGGGENVVGYNVLDLTMGNKPMKFSFKYPRCGNIKWFKKAHETSPNDQIVCGNLTTSVLDPFDLFYYDTLTEIFFYHKREPKSLAPSMLLF